MSLELKIESLTVAINSLIESINKQGIRAPIAPVVAPVVAAPVLADTAVVTTFRPPEGNALAMPTPVVVGGQFGAANTWGNASDSGVTVKMPAAPTFEIPQTITQIPQNGAPFSDPKGLIEFVMTSYKNLGPAKGAGIQGVLTGLGYQNINDVKAEHYAALFCGIESLKA